MCETKFPTAIEKNSFKYFEENIFRTKNLGGVDLTPLGQRRVNYKEALFVSGLLKLSERREICARDLFSQIKRPDHALNYLLTPKISPVIVGINKDKLRSCYLFEVPRAKT